MKLATEFIALPVRFDALRMAEEIAQFPERAWRAHPQGYPGNTALPLVAAYGDAANNDTHGPMRATPYLRQCPYLQQVLESFDTVIGRTRLMRLDGNAEATAHVDTNYYWLHRLRLHVPIVTDPAVRFICGDRSVHMAAGEAWVFDTWRTHNVINPNPTRRIHLVADTVGSSSLWSQIEHSQASIRFVAFDPARKCELRTEAVNRPVVMSPAEQEMLLAFFFDELGELPRLGELRARLLRFTRDWRTLWSLYGETESGWRAYAALRDELEQDLESFAPIALNNGVDAIEQLRQMIVRPALNPDLARTGSTRPAVRIDRPVFIVSSPRAGSTMLFEALARSPSVYTVGGESHAIIEGIDTLNPALRGYDSNRLTAEDATPAVRKMIAERFYAALRDRDGRRAEGAARMLEKTPKNSLRIPFLRAVFPDAFFIYLYRDPRATISSMLDAWRSERFVTYPDLPGWEDAPWSLLLVPHWRDLIGRPLAELAGCQWATATNVLLDDLEELPPEQWCVAAYDQIVKDPQREIARLCQFVGIEWDLELTAPLPLSRYTLTPPDPAKVQRNQAELAIVEPIMRETASRALELFARPPARRVRALQSRPAADPAAAFRSVSTGTFVEILHTLGSSLIVTTYQSGRVVFVRAESPRTLNTHLRTLDSPMGVAATPHTIAIGTRNDVRLYRNQHDVTSKLDPPGKHDACFVPHQAHVTGDVRIHEVAFAGDELWFVNTRFSALCTLDGEHSFVPRWRPPFVSHLAPEDRCHLNGMAVVDRRIRYVTALGETNADNGWRDRKRIGGVVIDVDGGEILLRGLCMPHSPRWYSGRFWFLESGKGTLGSADLASGKVETIAHLPGFTRGLAFAGPFAFVGLSQVRESNIFGGLPLAERVAQRQCGVWVVDLRTGQTVAFLRFEGSVQEIFDVQVLYGMRHPEMLEPSSPLVSTSYVLPQAAMADVARERGL